MHHLAEAACHARNHAHAAFSHLPIGAAVEDDRDRIFTGCNIESASYGLTMCAERVAVFKAISEGSRRLKRIAIVTDREKLVPPCGACRQVLWEFGGDMEVILASLGGREEIVRLSALLPRPFDRTLL